MTSIPKVTFDTKSSPHICAHCLEALPNWCSERYPLPIPAESPWIVAGWWNIGTCSSPGNQYIHLLVTWLFCFQKCIRKKSPTLVNHHLVQYALWCDIVLSCNHKQRQLDHGAHYSQAFLLQKMLCELLLLILVTFPPTRTSKFAPRLGNDKHPRPWKENNLSLKHLWYRMQPSMAMIAILAQTTLNSYMSHWKKIQIESWPPRWSST